MCSSSPVMGTLKKEQSSTLGDFAPRDSLAGVSSRVEALNPKSLNPKP